MIYTALALLPASMLAASTTPWTLTQESAPEEASQVTLDRTPILERPVVAGPVGPDGKTLPSYVADQVLVRFGAGVTPERIALALGENYAVERLLVPGLNLYLVQIVGERNVDQAVTELNGVRGILYAAPDHVVTQRDTFPNDPRFNLQYGKHNTGQTGGTADSDIDAPAAWDFSTGTSEFAVAIVDGGVDHAHADLVGNRWENTAELGGTPGVDDDGNGFVDDLYGWNAYTDSPDPGSDFHGTHVAGIAAAQGDNGIGVSGVSWDAEIVSIAGASGTTSTVLLAYSYALSLKDLWLSSNGTAGANVVATNSSFGVDFGDCNSSNYSPWNDMYDLMGQSGILSATATINAPENVDVIGDVPTGCDSDFVISVTATDDNDSRNFSGFGAMTIDLAAPGEDIESTVPGGGYNILTGTSMATPQVTGAIALLHSAASPAFASLRTANPAQAALELKAILLDTVDPIASLAAITVSGGRMNVGDAAAEIAIFGATTYNYCGPAVPNSTGFPGEIAAEGSNQVALNDFRLVSSNLPVGALAMVINSTTQGFTANPDGSSGNICLAGQVGRFVSQAGPVAADGTFRIQPDLTAFPQPTGFFPVMIGQTWNFQTWHRDSIIGSLTNNFTEGLSVLFE